LFEWIPRRSSVRGRQHLSNDCSFCAPPGVWPQLGAPSASVTARLARRLSNAPRPELSNRFTVLPKAARPKHDLYIKVTVYTPNTVTQTGTVLIEPDGTVQAYSAPASGAVQYTSLAGLSFPLDS